MCRLLAYQGIPQSLEKLIAKPEHSLIVQSYQPREMTAGVINADGFGIGWYHPDRDTEPFIYKHTQPIWTDINLPHLSRYVETGCMLSYVRSATPGQAVSLSNCQPFEDGKLLFIHNGFIDNFRSGLYKQIRDRLPHHLYQAIHGTTDSEHIFALFCNELHTHPELPLEIALQRTLHILRDLVEAERTTISANIVISDGTQIDRRSLRTSDDSTLFILDQRIILIIQMQSFWHPNRSLLAIGKLVQCKASSLSAKIWTSTSSLI